MKQDRPTLIKLIHVAKRELNMDDDSYRMLLMNETGKNTCSAMTTEQLSLVIDGMKKRGFKPRKTAVKTTDNKRLSPKSGKEKHAEMGKIRAIWIEMYRHCFVRDASETALDAYVRRMTESQGNKVDILSWCNHDQCRTVMESLKSWHRRCMINELKKHGWRVPTNQQGTKPAAYGDILRWYIKLQAELAAKVK